MKNNSLDITPGRDDFRRGRLPWQAQIALKAKEIVKTIIDAGGSMEWDEVRSKCAGKYYDAAENMAFRLKAMDAYFPQNIHEPTLLYVGKKPNNRI